MRQAQGQGRRALGAAALAVVCAGLGVLPGPPGAALAQESPSSADSLKGIVIGRDWPNWKGPLCSGAAGDCGEEMVDDIGQARLAWTSEQPFQPAWQGFGTDDYPNWGFSDFAIVDGRLYFRYTEASGPVSEREKENVRKHYLDPIFGPEGPSHKRKSPEWLDRMSTLLGKVRGDDVILCIDIRNGRTLWKTVFKEMGMSQVHFRPKNYGMQGTPCVAYGKAYAYGAGLNLYAVDQITGEPIWRADSGELAVQLRTHYLTENMRGRPGGTRERNYDDGVSVDGCPMPAGGAIAVSCLDAGNQSGDSSMAGFDAATGRPLWKVADCCGGTMNATPLRWRHNGKEYFVSGYRSRTVCVEPMTGRLLWQHEGFANSKGMGAIAGDYLVNVGDAWGRGKEHPPQCLKLSLDKAETVWRADRADEIRIMRYCSPTIYKGVVYLPGKGANCLDFATGKQLDRNAGVSGYNILAADGLVWGDKAGLAFAGPGGKELGRWSSDIPDCESETVQVMVGGRLYYRSQTAAHCIDLRRNPPEPAVEEADPPPAADIPGLVAQLGHRYLKVRERAVDALATAGAEAVPALADAMSAESWLVRQAAAQALQRLGGGAAKAAPALVRALPKAVEEDPWGQTMALLDTLKAVDPTALGNTVEPLAALTAQTDDLVLLRVCWALGEIGPSAGPAAPALAALVARDDAHVSSLAAEALGKIGPGARAAVPALVQALDSRHGAVVAWSLDALRRIGPPEDSIPRLVDLMWSPAVGDFDGRCSGKFMTELRIPLIAWQAGECLKAVGPEVVEPVAASLKGHQQHKFDPTMALDVLAQFPELSRRHLPAIKAFVDERVFDGTRSHYDQRYLRAIRGD